MTAEDFGGLLRAWAEAQGGTPHYSASYANGSWRFVLASGYSGNTIAVSSPTYSQAYQAMVRLMQSSLDAARVTTVGEAS
jgi:hypothetical protein